jgi:outer membrane protein OmpA-like peptidoglycan-associated protein
MPRFPAPLLSLALGSVLASLPAHAAEPGATPVASTAPATPGETAQAAHLDRLATDLGDALRRMGRLQAEVERLGQRVNDNGKAIEALGARLAADEDALAAGERRDQADAQLARNQAEGLAQLHAALAAAQRDQVALRAQLAQVESALVRHSAWIAQQQVASDTASTTASEALQRALNAGKLAEGKLVYESVLSEEMTRFLPYKADLGDSARAAIKDFAEKLKDENGNVYLEIQGHTDSSGARALNQTLSRQRAEAVRDFLNKECGIPMHRMEAVAYGDSKPIADNASKEGRAQNRRVTVVVLK